MLMRLVLRRSLLVALVILLLAEVGVRLVDDRLPSPQRWSRLEEQIKADDLKALADEPGGVVFLGSSMMNAAADPAVVKADLDRPEPVYNASLLGADTRITRLWATRLVVPTVRPSVAVIGVSCREIGSQDPALTTQYRQFVDAPAVRTLEDREKLLARVDEQVGRVSALVKHRYELRRPLNLVGGDERSTTTFTIDPDGQDDYFLERAYPAPQDVQDVLYRPDVTKLVLSQRRIDALADTVRDLRRESVDVVVVNMPVTQDYVSYLPAPSEQSNARCWRVLRETAEGAGARYVEAGVWDKALFADPIHLNGAGSRRFSAMLAEIVGSGM
jgi:hypothetical protein